MDAVRLPRVTERDHQEVIALCEDPHEVFDDVLGQPASPERLDQVAELADSLFHQAPTEEKVWDTLHLPANISARRLARLSERERTYILSRLPPHLADELTRILPINVS